MNGIEIPFELRFFIALALSFLVGLERESSGARDKGRVFSGVRTYSLTGVFGFGCAWFYKIGIAWMLPIGLVAITALSISGYFAKLKAGHVGWTSEVAMLLTYSAGALCLLAEIWVPLAFSIVGTYLLSEKGYIEKVVERLDQNEFLAVIKILIITIIILPILPDRDYTQFNLNPRKIWLIIVLVSSIGFVGYFLSKKFGQKIGLWLSGILGGIVSSTAASLAMGRIAQKSPRMSLNALQASILSCSIMYIRVLILILIIRPEFFHYFLWKLGLLAIIGLAISTTVRPVKVNSNQPEINALTNPFEMKPALIFAILFVALSVIIVLIRQTYGDIGFLMLSAVVGISDIDPFILSLISKEIPYQTVMVAAVLISMTTNTLAKGIYFGFMAKNVRRQTLIRFIIWAGLHIPLIFIPS